MSSDFRLMVIKLARIAGFVGPLIAYSFIGISIYINPWFSLKGHALSELGDPGKKITNYPWFYNLGLIISGFLTALFALGLLIKGRGLIERGSSLLVLIGSISLSLIGFFPSGTPLHVPVTATFYLLTSIGLLLFAMGLLRKDLIPALIMILTMVSLILLASVPNWDGAAIPELIGAVGISICIFIICLRFLK